LNYPSYFNFLILYTALFWVLCPNRGCLLATNLLHNYLFFASSSFSKTSGNIQRVQQTMAVRPATSSRSEKREKIRFGVNYNCEFCSRIATPHSEPGSEKAGQLDPTELLKLKNSRIKRLKKYEAKESEERGSGLVGFVGDGAG
jgi:hypothetical protein